ncbi:aminotransferase class IV family protein [Sphaerimonospora mesophila]|uniref:aminotransferase class IV family protein n=1 Tax=Sphaerimonospora mesophila TaxID=37483 RepID=UPI0006E40716
MAELNGKPVPLAALQVLGLVNYGHFTTMLVRDGHVRGLSHHLDRLVRDCRLVFAAELDPVRIRDHIRHALRDVRDTVVVRVTVFDPALELGRPGADAHPHILVTTRPAGTVPPAPMRVRTVAYQRDSPQVKHVGLFGALRVRRQAQRAGFDDALFVDAASRVTEGATWNIGFHDGERVVWPAGDSLPGVTMRLLRQVHGGMITASVDLAEVSGMRAAFATNSAIGVRPIIAIDDVELPGDHPVFEILRGAYEGIPLERI